MPMTTASQPTPQGSAVSATLVTEVMPDMTPEPELPVFDRAGMLSRLMDDEELAREIVEASLADIPQQMTALRRYLAADDVRGTERQAHTLKSVAASIGGERLRQVAFVMEQAAHAGDLAAVHARMVELASEFVTLKAAIAAEL